MATSVHSSETGTPDTGTWVQASAGNPSYVKVVMEDENEAKLEIVTSETNGAGAGSKYVHEVTVFQTESIVLPAGTYYINAKIISNDTTVDVTVQN